MKHLLCIGSRLPSVTLLFLFMLMMTGCNPTRYITERHIKNKIEQHNVGEFSNLRTFVIYRGAAISGSNYLEFTGYKYKGNKVLVIGTDRMVVDRKKVKEDKTAIAEYEFIELTLAQAQSILDQYKVLIDRLKSEKVKRNETVYHDFTVSPELFISFKKTKSQKGTDTIHFWVKGERYSLLQGRIIERLKQFVKY